MTSCVRFYHIRVVKIRRISCELSRGRRSPALQATSSEAPRGEVTSCARPRLDQRGLGLAALSRSLTVSEPATTATATSVSR